MRCTFDSIKNLKSDVFLVSSTIFLIFIAKDYPCLGGAGLALADFEAFLFFAAISLPCFFWSIFRITKYCLTIKKSNWEVASYFLIAIGVLIGNVIYLLIAIPVIFSFSPHPFGFLCG